MKIEFEIPKGFELVSTAQVGGGECDTFSVTKTYHRSKPDPPIMPEEMAACLRYMFGVGRWVAWDMNGECFCTSSTPHKSSCDWYGKESIRVQIPMPDGMSWSKSAMQIPPAPEVRVVFINSYEPVGYGAVYETSNQARVSAKREVASTVTEFREVVK